MECTLLYSVSSTNLHCLRVLRSHTVGKPEKLVVGDRKGKVVCLKQKKDQTTREMATEIVWEEYRPSQAVTALTINDDRIIVCFGNTIEEWKKKGRHLRTVELSLSEDISSVLVWGDRYFCSANRLHQCFELNKQGTPEELAFSVSDTEITDMVVFHYPFSNDELMRVSQRIVTALATHTGIILLRGSKQVGKFTTHSGCRVTSLCVYSSKHATHISKEQQTISNESKNRNSILNRAAAFTMSSKDSTKKKNQSDLYPSETDPKVQTNHCRWLMFGSETGKVGCLKITAANDNISGENESLLIELVWEFPNTVDDPSFTSAVSSSQSDASQRGSVSCMCVHRFKQCQSGVASLIVGRDSGIWDIFQFSDHSADSCPHICLSGRTDEMITSIDCGYVTARSKDDLVCVTFSGQILAFHIDAEHDFGAWSVSEQPTTHTRIATEIGADQLTPRGLRNEIEQLKREINEHKALLKRESKEMIAARKEFELKDDWRLDESDGCVVWNIQTDTALERVALASQVKLDIIAPDQCAEHQSDRGWTYVFSELSNQHSDQVSNQRFNLRFRAFEGESGEITAFVLKSGAPQTCRIIRKLIKPLALHIANMDIDHSEIERMNIGEWNSLTIQGEFTIRSMMAWLAGCLDGISLTTHSIDHKILTFKSSITTSLLMIKVSDQCLECHCQWLTTLVILRDYLTDQSVKESVRFDKVSLKPLAHSLISSLEQITPKLTHFHQLFHDHSLIGVLTEIAINEEDLATLSDKYKHILSDSSRIESEHSAAPLRLYFIERLIWSDISHFCRLLNIQVSEQHSESLHRYLRKGQITEMTQMIQKQIIEI